MSILYKVYAAVLGERLKKKVEGKRIIPPNQTRVRKGMGTVDNIYVLNYLVNKKLGMKKGKVIAMFVDLKAAFDSMDRGVLMEAMRQRGIRKGLIERIEEVLREIRSRVRVGKRVDKGFWTTRGVRQRCPLLFNLLIMDLEEEMDKVRWEKIKLERERMAYANDVVLLAEEENEIKSMIGRFEDYLERKRLDLNKNDD